ncbi:MAG TPA: response regulator, partial [Gemmataceae bacterium]|nr:response regulator [Gemmataceae bacterium]
MLSAQQGLHGGKLASAGIVAIENALNGSDRALCRPRRAEFGRRSGDRAEVFEQALDLPGKEPSVEFRVGIQRVLHGPLGGRRRPFDDYRRRVPAGSSDRLASFISAVASVAVGGFALLGPADGDRCDGGKKAVSGSLPALLERREPEGVLHRFPACFSGRAIAGEFSAPRESGQRLIALRREPFDLVLLDIEMPGMDGFRVLAQIREAGKGDHYVPVLAVTGKGGHQDEYLAAGFDGLSREALRASGTRRGHMRFSWSRDCVGEAAPAFEHYPTEAILQYPFLTCSQVRIVRGQRLPRSDGQLCGLGRGLQ